ncbi:hypothetical protein DIPPA_60792 [Diplonema papillatum]|nr:hypothetical protein DIPPA_60792 [Diplonema papillatum]
MSCATLILGMVACGSSPSPNIFMVLVDDFGWGDIGYHGAKLSSGESLTPTLDALVAEGIELNRHYVHMMCTPTRSSFQSGRLPIHVTTELVGQCDINGAIPRNITGIAAQLKLAGYETHQVGKWDCGMTTPHHTPQGRGYDTSLNYFGHGNWMWTEATWLGSYNNKSEIPPPTIIDFWNTDSPAKTLNGTGYEEYIFKDRMFDILNNHNKSRPLFLQYDSKVAHYPLESPPAWQEKFSSIEQVNRRVYWSMVSFLDDQLNAIVTRMKELDLWNNTLMVLSSDNGGYTKAEDGRCNTTSGSNGENSTDWGHSAACFNGETGASNYPLRGGKYTVFEGGIRVNAFVSGGFVPESQRGSKIGEMMHITDWYTTFCALAGVSAEDPWAKESGLPGIDGYNMWPLLSGENATSPRDTILVDNQLLVHKQWKYIAPDTLCYGNARGGPSYPNASTATDPIYSHTLQCPSIGCLFDVVNDPHEYSDVASQNPQVVQMMSELMAEQVKTIWTAPHGNDPQCQETAISKYGGFFGPWKEI